MEASEALGKSELARVGMVCAPLAWLQAEGWRSLFSEVLTASHKCSAGMRLAEEQACGRENGTPSSLVLGDAGRARSSFLSPSKGETSVHSSQCEKRV